MHPGPASKIEQLDSIAEQTRLPDELVVSDDASVDVTAKILEDFPRRFTISEKCSKLQINTRT
jgi:glycosyltransferase involved in cell wall biosynthesis